MTVFRDSFEPRVRRLCYESCKTRGDPSLFIALLPHSVIEGSAWDLQTACAFLLLACRRFPLLVSLKTAVCRYRKDFRNVSGAAEGKFEPRGFSACNHMKELGTTLISRGPSRASMQACQNQQSRSLLSFICSGALGAPCLISDHMKTD